MPVVLLTRALGLTRIAYGLGLLLAPRAVGGHWLGAGGAGAASQPSARSLGARDAVIGLATIGAIPHPRLCARVVALGAIGDTVDAVGTLLARREDGRVKGYYAGLAGAAAALSIVLARELCDSTER